MKKVEWNQTLSVGNEIIDKQHMKLFELRNMLIEAVDNKSNAAILAETLTEILKFTRSHFEFEEQFLEEKAYPDLQAHKKKHFEFKKKIAFISKEAISDRDSTQLKLISYLSEWIINHTSKSDLEYKKFI